MPYRPSFAGFELDAGSALAGVFPASFMAAAIGSGLTLAVVFASGIMTGDLSGIDSLYAFGFGAVFVMLLAMTVATGFCAFYIAVIGVTLAWLMGHKLSTPAGLVVAIAAASSGALVVATIFEALPIGPNLSWPFTAMLLAYALPAGLFYRRAVLNARSLSPFAELEPFA